MEYVIKKFSHKCLFFTMEFILSSIFTMIFYPLALQYLDMSLTNYYLLSMFIMILGGICLDRGFILMSISYEQEYQEIEKYQWIGIFITKGVIYTLAGISIWYFKHDAFLAMYIPLFLFFGGWIWFIVLNGYLNAKEDTDKNGLKIIKKIERKNR